MKTTTPEKQPKAKTKIKIAKVERIEATFIHLDPNAGDGAA